MKPLEIYKIHNPKLLNKATFRQWFDTILNNNQIIDSDVHLKTSRENIEMASKRLESIMKGFDEFPNTFYRPKEIQKEIKRIMRYIKTEKTSLRRELKNLKKIKGVK